MPNSRLCQVCGLPLEEGAPGGVCRRCLPGDLPASASDDRGAPDGDRTLAIPAGRPGTAASAPGDVEGTPRLTRAGHYKVLELLGEGGFGSVFLAEQEHPVRRRVAMKIIKLGMDTKQVIARFEAERQALALMDHPNIAKVLDAGATETGRPYFVMELVQGVPITQYCDGARLTPRERLELFVQVCQAVQHAHQKGVIHRDLKPSNVLVTMVDGRPVPKVIDFGIAKATQGRLTEKTLFTEQRQMIGTPEYMSPEQAESSAQDVDTRSDVYSLGVLLYELLAGTTPFDPKELRSKGYGEIQRIIREADPPHPGTRLSATGNTSSAVAANRRTDLNRLRQLLRGDLGWVVMKCLEKDRARRYETASALAADVGRHLRSEVVQAAPPAAGYRLRKFVSRHKASMTVAAVVVAALVLGLGAATWGMVRANRARLDAERARGETASALGQVTREKTEAEHQRRLALEAGQRVSRQLGEVFVGRGLDAWDRDDLSTAALWFIRGIQANENDQPWVDVQRVRLRSSLDRLPRLLDLPPNEVPDLGLNTTASRGRYLRPEGTTVEVVNEDTLAQRTPPLRHDGKVTSARFSQDGTRIVTATADAVRVWDASTGKPLGQPIRLDRAVREVALSPDNQQVAAASGNEGRVWDVATGKPMPSLLQHGGLVTNVAFSPNGKRVATASRDKTARVWDATSGQPVTPPLPHDDEVRAATFSHDSLRVVTASMDRTARVWDAATGAPLSPPLQHTVPLSDAAFSPDGRRVGTGGLSGWSLRLLDVSKCAWELGTVDVVSPRLLDNSHVLIAAFSPDGTRVATASADRTARVWDAATGKPLTPALQHEQVVHEIAFSPDGSRLVTASIDRTARVWDVATGRPLTPTLAHGQDVLYLRFSPDGRRLVTAGMNGAARIWDAAGGGADVAPFPHGGVVRMAAFSRDGRRVVTASDDTTARVWDAATGRPLTPPLAHELAVLHADFSPDGRLVVTTSRDQTARVWDAATGRPVCPPLRHGRQVTSAAFSPDGRRVVTVSENVAAVWDAATGQALGSPIQSPDDVGFLVTCACFSPDSQTIVVGCDKSARVWNAATGKPLMPPLPHGDAVLSAGFSPDGRRIVTQTAYAARVWDTAGGQPLSPRSHQGRAVRSIASPDGRRMATINGGGTARVWELGSEQREIDELRKLVELLAAQRVDDSGTAIRLTAVEWQERWNEVRQSHPEAFRPSPVNVADEIPRPLPRDVAAAWSEYNATAERILRRDVEANAPSRMSEFTEGIFSTGNLRQIFSAMLVFANEHKGFCPDNMGALLDQGLTPENFVRPGSGNGVPPNLKGDALLKWVNESSDYAYVGAGLKLLDVSKNTLLVHEKPLGQFDGLRLLFADGRVEFLPMSEATERIKRASTRPQQQ